MHLTGQLKVDGGELLLVDCVIKRITSADVSDAVRPLMIRGGQVSLTRIMMNGHLNGAITVHSASLTLVECTIEGCHAQYGGGILIDGRSEVRIRGSILALNTATVS
eukprot:114221-Prymnesium_polylepis.1